MGSRLEEMKIMSTVGDLEEFKKSIIWRDIRRELKAWKRGFERERNSIVDESVSSNLNSAQVLMHLGDLNGRTKAVDYLLSLPDVFISILQDQINKSEVSEDGN